MSIESLILFLKLTQSTELFYSVEVCLTLYRLARQQSIF